MDLRVALVLVDEIDATADVRQQAERAPDRREQPPRERVIQDIDRHFALRRRLTELRGSRESDLAMLRRVVVPRRPEQPVASAQHCLGIDRERRADARRRFDRLGITLLGWRAIHAGVDQATLQCLPRKRRPRLWHERVDRIHCVPIEAHGLLVVHLLQAIFMLEAKPVVQREAGTDTPVVLVGDAPVTREPFKGSRIVGHGARIRKAQEQAGHLLAPDAVSAGKQRVELKTSAQGRWAIGTFGRRRESHA